MNVKNLTFGYTDKNLIEKLSLQIGANDRICIIGRNGKGKSTLLKLITGDVTAKEVGNKLIVFDNDNVSFFEGDYASFLKMVG